MGRVGALSGLVILVVLTGACRAATPEPETGRARQARTYTTRFDHEENPISENGLWINGGVTGLDWSNLAVASGIVYGTETGTRGYDDSTALLSGEWDPNQSVEATVHSTNQNDTIYEEVELRLRSLLAAHRATGYEINFRCSKTANAYAEIVRWNGRLGDFTYLKRGNGTAFGVAEGDVVRATIVGNVITAFVNGVEVLRAVDSAFGEGKPGLGFFLQGATGVNRDFGFKDFTASDKSGARS